jgi:tetratricopeptide (TPR) repeat protein
MPAFKYNCTADTDYDLFDYMVHNYPRSAWLYTMRGRALLERHDYDHAISDFSMALSIDDKLPDAWQGRARGYEESGKLDYALTDYDKAIALNETRCIAYLDRGVLKAKLKDYDGAIADAGKAISLCPKEYQAYQNRATDLMKKGQIEEALRDYVFVIQSAKDPDTRLHSLSDKVSMLFSLDQKSLACKEEDLQLTRTLIPDSERGAIAYNMLGLCDEWNGKFVDAIRDYFAFWDSLPHDIEPMPEIEEGVGENIMEALYHFYPDNLQMLAPFRGDLVKVASRMLHEGRQTKGVMLAGFAGDNDQLLSLAKDFPATSEKFNKMSSSEKTNTLVIAFAVVVAAKSGTIPLQAATKGKANLRNVLLFASQPAVAAQMKSFEKIVADRAAKSNSRGIAGFWPD